MRFKNNSPHAEKHARIVNNKIVERIGEDAGYFMLQNDGPNKSMSLFQLLKYYCHPNFIQTQDF
jgi:hypothetical protein